MVDLVDIFVDDASSVEHEQLFNSFDDELLRDSSMGTDRLANRNELVFGGPIPFDFAFALERDSSLCVRHSLDLYVCEYLQAGEIEPHPLVGSVSCSSDLARSSTGHSCDLSLGEHAAEIDSMHVSEVPCSSILPQTSPIAVPCPNVSSEMIDSQDLVGSVVVIASDLSSFEVVIAKDCRNLVTPLFDCRRVNPIDAAIHAMSNSENCTSGVYSNAPSKMLL